MKISNILFLPFYLVYILILLLYCNKIIRWIILNGCENLSFQQVLYVLKPLCHLAAIGRYGSSSWIPWSLSLFMDVSSLKLLRLSVYNSEDVKEIRRRQLTLLMYLLRSPFYDSFSRKIVLQTLTTLRTIPLIGVLPHHILQYMLFWQKIYFYTWD